MDKSPQELYQERLKRYEDAQAGRVPDRIPIPLFTVDFHARYAGYTLAETVYDGEKLSHSVEKTVLDFEPDCFEQQHTRNLIGHALDLVGYIPEKWPGGEIGDDDPFQYLDMEIMKGDEYDELINDPSWYFMRRMVPRTARNLRALEKFPNPTAFLYHGIVYNLAAFGTPEMKQAMDLMHEVGKLALSTIEAEKNFIRHMANKGFPAQRGGAMVCPFDAIVDFMRGAKGGMLDVMRRGDKLLAAIDAVTNTYTKYAIELATLQPSKTLFIPLHWGIDSFMSPDQFKTFYWPQLRRVINMTIEAGLTPMPFFEGDCTSRLEIIADVPPGKCTYLFESTDLFKAKKILGDVVCIRGGMPASLLIAGSVTEVEEHTRLLIKELGRGGGYIIDSSAAGIPREARFENVRAMFDTVKRYGVY